MILTSMLSTAASEPRKTQLEISLQTFKKDGNSHTVPHRTAVTVLSTMAAVVHWSIAVMYLRWFNNNEESKTMLLKSNCRNYASRTCAVRLFWRENLQNCKKTPPERFATNFREKKFCYWLQGCSQALFIHHTIHHTSSTVHHTSSTP